MLRSEGGVLQKENNVFYDTCWGMYVDSQLNKMILNALSVGFSLMNAASDTRAEGRHPSP